MGVPPIDNHFGRQIFGLNLDQKVGLNTYQTNEPNANGGGFTQMICWEMILPAYGADQRMAAPQTHLFGRDLMVHSERLGIAGPLSLSRRSALAPEK